MSFESRRIWILAFAGMTIMGGCKQQETVDPNSLVACKPAGATAFARQCAAERDDGPDGTILTLRHPDGRFRRLLVTRDGRGVSAADGAEPAGVRMSGDKEIEVRIAGDRYRLPAKLRNGSVAR